MKQYDYLEEIDEDEIDLVDLIKIILKRKFLIIGVIIVATIISIIAGGINHSNSKNAAVIIGYNHEGIFKGLSPDGNRFVDTEIKNIIVARKVYNKYPILRKKGIDLTKFSSAIKIEGIIPDDTYKLAENSLKQGNRFIYTPTDYVIKLKITGDSKLDKEILTDLVTEYIQYFNYKYKGNETVPNINITKFLGYDFDDSVKIMGTDIDIASRMAKRLSEKDFVSKRTGLTYADVSETLDNLKNVDLQNVESKIETSSITNNILERKATFNSKIKKLKLEKDKSEGRKKVLKEMLRDYKPSIRKMILPTLGEMGIKISTEEEYYTKLLMNYEIVATKIQELGVDIVEMINEKSKLNEDSIVKESVRNQLELVGKKYNEIASDMNKMNKEYYNKYFSDSVRVIVPTSVTSDSKAKVIVLAGIIFGIMLGLGSAFVAEFIDHYKENKSKK